MRSAPTVTWWEPPSPWRGIVRTWRRQSGARPRPSGRAKVRPVPEGHHTLTPYLVEEIAEDALAAGRAARLELTVPADTDDTGVAWLRGQFTGLGSRGVEVTVRRNVPASPAHPHAA